MYGYLSCDSILKIKDHYIFYLNLNRGKHLGSFSIRIILGYCMILISWMIGVDIDDKKFLIISFWINLILQHSLFLSSHLSICRLFNFVSKLCSTKSGKMNCSSPFMSTFVSLYFDSNFDKSFLWCCCLFVSLRALTMVLFLLGLEVWSSFFHFPSTLFYHFQVELSP